MFKVAPSGHDYVVIAEMLLQYEITDLNKFIKSSKESLSPCYQNNLNSNKQVLRNYF